ncbi:hypothetical protein PDN92_30065, partial [Escherichia coli]|nr:hypothetical protein [Escherichia coli]
LKSQGDSLRGEIGGVYRDARAHTDSQVTAVRDELKAEGDSLRGEIGGEPPRESWRLNSLRKR